MPVGMVVRVWGELRITNRLDCFVKASDSLCFVWWHLIPTFVGTYDSTSLCLRTWVKRIYCLYFGFSILFFQSLPPVLLFLICKRTPDSWITPFRLETKMWRSYMKTSRFQGDLVMAPLCKWAKSTTVQESCWLWKWVDLYFIWGFESFFTLICEVLNTPNISSHRRKSDYFLFVFYFFTDQIIKKSK